MLSKVYNYEDSLEELCVIMIRMLNELKEKGIINEEEYRKQTSKKIEFLNR